MKAWLAVMVVLFPAAAQAQTCPPPGWSRQRLEALRTAEFEIADASQREGLARALTACLASPDPRLRDAIAFEGLSHMFRGNALSAPTEIELARDLLVRLGSRDRRGFEAPFAALALAEVMRADGNAPFLPDDLRDAIAEAAAHYVENVRDYRGFDAREGWRHGVAHGADLLMRIARHPRANRHQLERAREAIASQVAPAGHFYIYGEPERLMTPIILIARRGIFSEAEWTDWFAQLAAPTPLAAWSDVFSSQPGLARRHNLRAFLNAVWFNARLSTNAEDDVLLAGAEAALRIIP